jgi:hypothetical protein
MFLLAPPTPATLTGASPIASASSNATAAATTTPPTPPAAAVSTLGLRSAGYRWGFLNRCSNAPAADRIDPMRTKDLYRHR